MSSRTRRATTGDNPRYRPPHDIAAIDDGRKNKSRMRKIVHHVDGRRPPGTRRHRRTDIAPGAEDRNDAGEVGCQRIVTRNLYSRRVRRPKTAYIMIAVVAYQRMRAGRRQQAQFGARQVARTNKKYGTGLQIKKYGRNRIRYSLPRFRVDWNYFLYMSHSTSQRENSFFSIAMQL